MLDPGSKARLGPFVAELFEANTLFGRVARALAEAECLPRKELFEAWEVARRTQRRLRRSKRHPTRIVDLACGHGLTGALLALIEPKIGHVLAVDRRIPPCAEKSLAALVRRFPQLAGRCTLVEAEIEATPLASSDVVVCVHGCGPLTDLVLDKAIAAGAMVAVLPCCHRKTAANTGGLEGWCDFALATDVMRAERLRAAHFSVHTQHIPENITPKNRLLIGVPPVALPATQPERLA